jgi:hypothetical protein
MRKYREKKMMDGDFSTCSKRKKSVTTAERETLRAKCREAKAKSHQKMTGQKRRRINEKRRAA